MPIRGIRGATTIGADVKEQVSAATQELLNSIQAANPGLRIEDIASAWFTVSDDIVSTYPALAARQIGWDLVPMLCAREIPVPDGLPLCIRVLIHWNTDREQRAIKHVYLREAVKLRADLVPRS
jgi:chorismate mutase